MVKKQWTAWTCGSEEPLLLLNHNLETQFHPIADSRLQLDEWIEEHEGIYCMQMSVQYCEASSVAHKSKTKTSSFL